MSIQYEKMAQAGFTPSQRALEADEYIKGRNRFDHPDEFQYVGSSVGGPDGYMYIGPARFYTSGTEYAGWLNSGLGGERYADGNAVAQAIDDNPAVPEGPFGPITTYNAQTSNNNDGMLTGQQEPDRTTQIPSFCPSGFEYPDGTCVPMEQTQAATGGNNNTPPPPAQPTRASVADVNALYQKYLGRDARPEGLDYWRSTGQYADRPIESLDQIAYNISISKEAQNYAASQQDSTSASAPSEQPTRASIEDVVKLYQQYLGRNPLQKGLDYWRSTGSYADRPIESLDKIAYNISISPEAQEYAASQAQTDTGAFTGGVNVGGGSFTPGTPQGLSYTPMQLPSVAPAPSVQNVDYVKMIRGALTNSLFKDLV